MFALNEDSFSDHQSNNVVVSFEDFNVKDENISCYWKIMDIVMILLGAPPPGPLCIVSLLAVVVTPEQNRISVGDKLLKQLPMLESFRCSHPPV